VSQRIPLNQNRRVTGTTEILELCKDMLRLEHGIGNDFDMDTAEFTEFRAQFLADFAQIPLIIGIDGRSGTGKTSPPPPHLRCGKPADMRGICGGTYPNIRL